MKMATRAVHASGAGPPARWCSVSSRTIPSREGLEFSTSGVPKAKMHLHLLVQARLLLPFCREFLKIWGSFANFRLHSASESIGLQPNTMRNGAGNFECLAGNFFAGAGNYRPRAGNSTSDQFFEPYGVAK